MRAVTAAYPKVSVRKGREWPIAHGHPWLFSGGISQAPKVTPGSLVDLVDVDGKFVARGYYNPGCDIAVRVLTTKDDVDIDQDFFQIAIAKAWQLRQQAIDITRTNVFRLINAEGDGLPGYIVDYYAGVAVLQCHTAGADTLLPLFLPALEQVIQPKAVIVRNDASVRRREGLELEPPKVVAGGFEGELLVSENGLHFAVDPLHGQKTGYFTDQRDKRLALQSLCQMLPAESVLANCFSYTGSFSVYTRAVNGGLRTINIDESQPALDQAHRNFSLNNLPAEQQEFVQADAFAWMESQIAHNRQFEVVVVDPPAFAKTNKDKPKALKAYKRMDKLAIAITKPDGLLVTCSCSGSVSLAEFEEALKEAAQESGRQVQVLQTFKHGADHPVLAITPEANYLKVLFCRVC
ncbi:MAG TPA: class I SAM-dependent rRNA methyltransferase [Candidatus Obscuribacterales bacterium]